MNAKNDIVYAVEAQLGIARDELARARIAWGRYVGNPVMLDQQYGDSGKTIGELLQASEAEVSRWEAALAAAKSQS